MALRLLSDISPALTANFNADFYALLHICGDARTIDSPFERVGRDPPHFLSLVKQASATLRGSLPTVRPDLAYIGNEEGGKLRIHQADTQ